MYVVHAKAASNKVEGEAKKHKWVDKKDVNLLMKDFRRIEKKIDNSVDFIDREYLNIDSPSL